MYSSEQTLRIKIIEREFPSHQIWVVNRVVGGPVWCARPWGSEDVSKVINQGSENELVEALIEIVDHQPL